MNCPINNMSCEDVCSHRDFCNKMSTAVTVQDEAAIVAWRKAARKRYVKTMAKVGLLACVIMAVVPDLHNWWLTLLFNWLVICTPMSIAAKKIFRLDPPKKPPQLASEDK